MSDVSVRMDGSTRKHVPSPKVTFEMPNFDMPKFEMPAAMRDLVEKGGTQAKENYAKMKAANDEMAGVVEATYGTATKGAADYGLKVIEMTRINANAAFDFVGKLMAVRSPSEAVELSAAHARQQFDVVSAQSKELWAFSQKVATSVVEPIKTGMSKALQRNA